MKSGDVAVIGLGRFGFALAQELARKGKDVLVIDRTIDVNINRLRKKIGNYGNDIITKQGFGYGFKE